MVGRQAVKPVTLKVKLVYLWVVLKANVIIVARRVTRLPSVVHLVVEQIEMVQVEMAIEAKMLSASTVIRRDITRVIVQNLRRNKKK